MNAQQWSRVKELFHAALEHSPAGRPAFLETACDGDAALLAEVTRLLDAHAQASQFIEQSPVSLTGRRIGRYDVGRLIGIGGMGEVYAARDSELGREVALKIASRADADAQTRLRREAQHASRLNHPNICTVHEVGTESGHQYIVMEYVAGRQISELIPEGGLQLATVLRYGIQIAAALAHAHERGVVHRDLKATNVIITTDGRPKVLDFGLSRQLPSHATPLSRAETSLTAEGLVGGTPSYMAPELLRGAPADARSDIWALGVLLYEMGSGVRPFHGKTGFELSAAILHESPPPLPERIPTSLQIVIRRCLVKDPQERYQQAIEVRSALETVLPEVTAVTGQPTRLPQQRAGRPALLSGRALLACGAGVLLLAIVLAIALTWKRQTPSAPVAIGASGRPAVAVMNFEIAGDRRDDAAWLSKGVSSMLVTGLAQMRGLDIVSGQRLREVSEQVGFDNLDALDRKRAADVAKRAGAGAIVVGSIFNNGSEVRIDAQLEDLSSGRVLAAESVRGTDLFALVDQLAAKIRDGIGLGTEATVRHVAEISSASPEAYRLYSNGVDAFNNARWADAANLLEQAVAIDPEFAQAYLNLALVHQWLGNSESAETYLRKSAGHVERLTEREQLLIQAELARLEGRSAEAARLLDQLVERFPALDSSYPLAMQLYGVFDSPLQDPAKMVSIAEVGVKALPGSRSLLNIYAYALMGAGRLADAGRELEKLARIAPREPNPYDSLGELHLVIGDPDKAVEFYSRALTVDPTFPSRVGRSWAWATLGRYEEAVADHSPSSNGFILSRAGRYHDAERETEIGLKEAEAEKSVTKNVNLYLLSSVFAIERGNYVRARQGIASAEQRLAQLPGDLRRIYLVASGLLAGITEARAGQLAGARMHLDGLKSRHRSTAPTEVAWRAVLEAEVALAANQPAQAAAAYSDLASSGKNWFGLGSGPWLLAASLPFRDGLARAKKAQGDLTGAITTYRNLLTPGAQHHWTAAFEPRYVLEMARLLEQSGDKTGAREEYARFLDLWNQADAGLPELAEARRAVARLR